jgi:hypothetical protein
MALAWTDSRVSREWATVTALTALLFGTAPALAGPLRYLARDELLCEPSKVTCMRATLCYEVNDRLLRLRGRLLSASGPGLIRITLTGTTRQGYRRYAPMEIAVRGRPTEIVDFKMIPDHPDVYDWVIDRMEFVELSADSKARSGN